MSTITIELESRDWKEFRTQNIEGVIVKNRGKFEVQVEIPQLPGHFVNYNYNCPVELNESLVGLKVVGDLGDAFYIRVLCLFDADFID